MCWHLWIASFFHFFFNASFLGMLVMCCASVTIITMHVWPNTYFNFSRIKTQAAMVYTRNKLPRVVDHSQFLIIVLCACAWWYLNNLCRDDGFFAVSCWAYFRVRAGCTRVPAVQSMNKNTAVLGGKADGCLKFARAFVFIFVLLDYCQILQLGCMSTTFPVSVRLYE